MTPEWEELKGALCKLPAEFSGPVLAKMTEIERRTLPERAADLIDHCNFDRYRMDVIGVSAVNIGTAMNLLMIISKALRAGDLTELAKW